MVLVSLICDNLFVCHVCLHAVMSELLQEFNIAFFSFEIPEANALYNEIPLSNSPLDMEVYSYNRGLKVAADACM